ncbi:hypothetical protein, partial [Parabacteroides acidifaciens]|uniref:hypothetical protein n=1 Tax=Parabacteroides acidifaciens TaxID=2290935 RepID=UPI001ABFC0D4
MNHPINLQLLRIHADHLAAGDKDVLLAECSFITLSSELGAFLALIEPACGSPSNHNEALSRLCGIFKLIPYKKRWLTRYFMGGGLHSLSWNIYRYYNSL